ncbi:hypothetical protein JCM11641_007462 [Rhodosporidiobolus odoratus]
MSSQQRNSRKRPTVSTSPSVKAASTHRHFSCEGCRLRKQRCSRTADCRGCQTRGIECVWNGSAPSRTSEAVTIDEQEREIHRLNGLVARLSTRVLDLGGKVADLLPATSYSISSQEPSPSGSAELLCPPAPVIKAEPPSPVTSGRSPSIASSASASSSSAEAAVDLSGLHEHVEWFGLLSPEEPSYSTPQPPSGLVTGPHSAPSSSYTFPPSSLPSDPSSTRTFPGPVVVTAPQPQTFLPASPTSGLPVPSPHSFFSQYTSFFGSASPRDPQPYRTTGSFDVASSGYPTFPHALPSYLTSAGPPPPPPRTTQPSPYPSTSRAPFYSGQEMYEPFEHSRTKTL